MSQHDFSPINPATYSGTDLSSDLNSWVPAVISSHSGASRPSYAPAGLVWFDTGGGLKFYNGSTDDLILKGAITAFGVSLAEAADATAGRALLGLGSAATLTAGTAANNAVQLDGSARLPAVDASQLTNLPGGGVVKQIKRNTPLTSTVSVSSTSFAAVSGLAAPAITMSDSANGIRVSAIVTGGSSSTNVATFIEVYRDGTPIYQGDAAGSRVRTFSSFSQGNSNETYLDSKAIVFTDFPGDTAAHTYQVYAKTASGTGYINRTATDADNASYSRGVSTIEVMEVTE